MKIKKKVITSADVLFITKPIYMHNLSELTGWILIQPAYGLDLLKRLNLLKRVDPTRLRVGFVKKRVERIAG